MSRIAIGWCFLVLLTACGKSPEQELKEADPCRENKLFTLRAYKRVPEIESGNTWYYKNPGNTWTAITFYVAGDECRANFQFYSKFSDFTSN